MVQYLWKLISINVHVEEKPYAVAIYKLFNTFYISKRYNKFHVDDKSIIFHKIIPNYTKIQFVYTYDQNQM